MCRARVHAGGALDAFIWIHFCDLIVADLDTFIGAGFFAIVATGAKICINFRGHDALLWKRMNWQMTPIPVSPA